MIINSCFNRKVIDCTMKKYIEPSIKIKDIVVEASMMSFSDGVGDPNESHDGGLSNSRRGQWGNLWYDDSEEE